MKRITVFVVILLSRYVTAAAEPQQTLNQLFEAKKPFPDTRSINALLECYPEIPVDQADSLRKLLYVAYRERSATEEENAVSTCGSRRFATYVSERTFELKIPEMSPESMNQRLAKRASNDCEETRSFGQTTIASITTSSVTLSAPAFYRKRSCGIFGKNNKYKWRGNLLFTFPLEPTYVPVGCTGSSADCNFVGHKFLEPKVGAVTIEEKKYYLSAALDPKALVGALIGGLFGPGGAALGFAIGAGISTVEIDKMGGAAPTAVQAGNAELSAIVDLLVDKDIMASLSRAVSRVANEVELIPFNYKLNSSKTGFVEGEPNLVGYRFFEASAYCSNALNAVLKERKRTIERFQSFSSCEERTVVVAPGDSLWKLAQRFYDDGYAHILLARRNGLKPDSGLAIGAALSIPSICDLCRHRNSSELVLLGSSLESMAKAKGLSPTSVARIRTMSGNPDLIFPYELVEFPQSTGD